MKNRKPENVALLNERIEQLSKVVEMLKEIRDNPDVGEKKTCEKYGIDFPRFRRFVYDTNWLSKESEASQSEESTIRVMNAVYPTMSWYERLWCDVMGLRPRDIAVAPEDVEETLTHMIETYLDDRQQKVILYQYKDNLELGEVGKLIGVTRERVRQISEKAIRKLKCRRGWISIGDSRAINKLKIQEKIEEDVLIAVKHKVLQELDSEMVSLKKIISDATGAAVEEYKEQHPDMPLSELDLSVRAYVCLARAGIKTLSELRECRLSEILKIRNMGEKCAYEIKDTLEKMGYSLRKEKKKEEE